MQGATGSEPASYSYDSNGNITNDATHTYQFSQRNRLATVDAGTTATYSYDGDGRRVKKVAGGTTTLYFYDAEGKLLEEYIPSTGAGKDYVFIPKSYEPIARIDFSMTDADTGDVLRLAKSSPNVHLDWNLFSGSGNFLVRRGTIGDFSSYSNIFGPSALKTYDDPVLEDTSSYWYDNRDRSLTDTLYFYHANHLGTPIAMTDTSGTLVWRAEHAPLGSIYALPVSTIGNNLRFPGQYFDGETGLSQNWFRDYEAKIGRYWEVDAVGYMANITPYSYAQNNPITVVDSRGQTVEICFRPLQNKTAAIFADHAYIRIGEWTAGFYDDDKVSSPDKDKGTNPSCSAASKKKDCDCEKWTPKQTESCVKSKAAEKPRKPYDLLTYNCGTWIKEVFNSCCLKPKTPGHTY